MEYNIIPDLNREDKKTCDKYMNSIEDIGKKGSLIGFLPKFLDEGNDRASGHCQEEGGIGFLSPTSKRFSSDEVIRTALYSAHQFATTDITFYRHLDVQ